MMRYWLTGALILAFTAGLARAGAVKDGVVHEVRPTEVVIIDQQGRLVTFVLSEELARGERPATFFKVLPKELELGDLVTVDHHRRPNGTLECIGLRKTERLDPGNK